MRAWLLWSAGVAAFPIGAAFVPSEVVAVPRILTDTVGLEVWSLWAAGFVAMSVAMFDLRGVGLRSLLVAQTVAGFAFVFAHAMPSIDTYAYLGYGDLFLRGFDPWHPAFVLAFDDVSRSFVAVWGARPPACRYGPVLVVFEAAMLETIPPSSIVTVIFVQRAVSLGAAVAITALVRGPNARYWALNPFVGYYFVLQAHNDVFFLLVLAVAARIRNPLLAGLATGVAGAIKIVALGVLGFVRFKSTGDTIARFAGAVCGMAIAYLCVRDAIAADGLFAQATSLGSSLRSILGVASRSIIPNRSTADAVAAVAVAIACIAIVVSLRWRRRDALAMAALVALVALPVFWPWYLGWALLGAVASSTQTTMNVVLGLCASSFVFELPQIWRSSAELPITIGYFAIVVFVLVRSGAVRRSVGIPGRTAD